MHRSLFQAPETVNDYFMHMHSKRASLRQRVEFRGYERVHVDMYIQGI
jgi:hypothetical protein